MSDIDLESAISQFYEDESLTDALTDQPAQTLLKWGEQQLGVLAEKSADADEFDAQFTQLRKLIKNMSRFIAEHQQMAEDEQQESVQKMMTVAQGVGFAINNAVSNIIEEQKSLSDDGSVAHLIAQFVSQSAPASSQPTPIASPPPIEEAPIDPFDAPVEDITEILPKGGLMDFIKRITTAVEEAQNKPPDPSTPPKTDGFKPSAEDDEF